MVNIKKAAVILAVAFAASICVGAAAFYFAADIVQEARYERN